MGVRGSGLRRLSSQLQTDQPRNRVAFLLPVASHLVITHIFSPAILPPLLGTRERIPERQHWDGTAGLFETPTASLIPAQGNALGFSAEAHSER